MTNKELQKFLKQFPSDAKVYLVKIGIIAMRKAYLLILRN